MFFIVHPQFPTLDLCTINHDAFRSGLVMTEVMKMNEVRCAVEQMGRMKYLDLEPVSGPGNNSDSIDFSFHPVPQLHSSNTSLLSLVYLPPFLWMTTREHFPQQQLPLFSTSYPETWFPLAQLRGRDILLYGLLYLIRPFLTLPHRWYWCLDWTWWECVMRRKNDDVNAWKARQ